MAHVMWVIEPHSTKGDLTILLEFPSYFLDSNTHKKPPKLRKGLRPLGVAVVLS